MRLLVTADLHYGLRDAGDASTRELAQRICASDADALVLAGDNASMEPELFAECFRLFEGFRGRKLTICGNHDLWSRNGDSLSIYHERFASWAGEAGFECLEGSPVIIGNVGLVGTVGWYDYSFRDETLGIEERFYEQKFHPRLARWNDGQFIKMPLSDAEFSELVTERLVSSIQGVYEQVETIVAVTHMLAFDCMIVHKRVAAWDFCSAFMGSRTLGETLLRYPKVGYHFCGHAHQPSRHRVGHLETINVGSNYDEKRCEILEL